MPAFPVGMEEEIRQIADIGRLRAPNEAGGVLLPTPHKGQRVWELPNRSTTPLDGTRIHVADIRLELAEWLETDGKIYADEMVIWHTHPAGHIGPSKADLDQAVPELTYLVVTLTEGGHIPVWYRSNQSIEALMRLREVRDDGADNSGGIG